MYRLSLILALALLMLVGAANAQDDAVIQLGDETITEAEFDTRFSLAARGVAAQQGLPYNDETRALFESLRPAYLEQLATELVLLDEARTRGVTAPDADIDAQLETARTSFGGDEAYNQFLSESGFADEAAFRGYLSDALTIQAVVDELSQEIEVGDEDIQAFYDENQERINQPLENVREQVRQALVQQRIGERVAELRAASDVQVFAENLSMTGGEGLAERQVSEGEELEERREALSLDQTGGATGGMDEQDMTGGVTGGMTDDVTGGAMMDAPTVGETVELFDEGILEVAPERALENIQGWQARLRETDDPALMGIADTLGELESALQAGADGTAAAVLLSELGEQTRAVAETAELDADLAAELDLLASLLVQVGQQLESGVMEETTEEMDAEDTEGAVSPEEFATLQTAFYEIYPTENSNIDGTVQVTENADGGARATVTLQNAEDGMMYPSHFHTGDCGTGGEIVYPLEPIPGGPDSIVTTVDASVFDVIKLRLVHQHPLAGRHERHRRLRRGGVWARTPSGVRPDRKRETALCEEPLSQRLQEKQVWVLTRSEIHSRSVNL